MPRRPHIEATLTMAGLRPFRSTGMAKRINSAGAKKLTSMTRRRMSSELSAKWHQLPTPALLTSTSRPSKRSTTVAKMCWRSASLVTSPGTATASAPKPCKERASSCNLSADRAVSASRAPRGPPVRPGIGRYRWTRRSAAGGLLASLDACYCLLNNLSKLRKLRSFSKFNRYQAGV